ncbi:SCO-spondin-like [Haliotis rufescens]|uniref:SCO-spondin-like n=1 Tax=Haliotis rufescens TaxID=6454 RepID=UPI00201F2BC8|nr:SCO-spondin-like [Haliotis rufescens]
MIGRVLLFCLCILACHIDLSHQQVFLLELQNATAAVGSTTYFQAAVLGTITGQGNWSRNGVPIVHQPGKYNILTTGIFRQLFITNTALSDAGTISFRINGEVSSAQLTVLQGAVSIVSGLTPQTVNTGSTVTLQATLSQSNIQTGQWFKNGAVLTTNARIQTSVNGQSQILSISNVQTSDRATYEYRVNGLSTSALLTVNVPIGAVSIVSGLTPQTVNTGSTVTLQATLSQTNIQTGQWFKNGAVLTTNARIQTFVNGQSQILSISNVQTSDGATYEYRVNGLSTSALLTVNVPIGAVSIVSGLTPQTVNTGSTVTLQATLSQTNIQTGQWFKNGAVLTTNARIQTFVNGQSQILSISNVQTSDGATYEYRVNGLSTSALLTVNVPIGAVSIVSGLTPQTVNTGSTVTLQATLSQTNIQTGQWFKNGAVLTTNARIQTFVNGQSQILSISNVQTSDGATYEYRVNGLSTSALLTVNVPIGAVSIVSGLPPQTVNTGSTVTLQATLSKSNIQTGQWFKNGAVLTTNARIQTFVNGQFQILSISNVQTSDGATYEYRVNGLSTSALLTVNVPIGPIVNGGLSQWTEWTGLPCGVACETRTDVIRTRTRSCSNPPPSNGGLNCTGSFVDVLSACVGPVNGGFSLWSEWSDPSCGITCGSTNGIIRSRTRRCTNPVPSNGGLPCFGDVVQTSVKTCSFAACQVNGGLTAWTQWTDPPCGITCGQRSDVMRTRTRSCSNPLPSNGGRDCTGSLVEILQKTCFFPACVVNGGLTPWSQWSGPPCDLTCGAKNDVVRTRTRSCTNPAPSNGGLNCTGPFVEVKASCVVPVNGGFTQWTQWTNPSCGITCGSTSSVLRSRTRSCTNPIPTNGGLQCSGDSVETLVKTCVFPACPVNGGLTLWTQWTNPPCGISCGTRTDLTRTRTRSCTNPPPSNGGQGCAGLLVEVEPRNCDFAACIVNGGFTLWTQWTNPPCGITCGRSTEIRTRIRSCTNPAPSNGGTPCTGPIIDILSKSCDFTPCVVAVNGGFTQWTQWTTPSCGITCGSTNSLVRSRTRSCTNPFASNGGQQCFGNTIETLSQPCVFSACRAPLNGGLTQWTTWTNPGCGITCGVGASVSRTRVRTCTNPAPANGGQVCTGPFVQVLAQTCSFSPCAVNGGFTQWSQWTNPTCGISCGSTNSVVRSRFRSCTNPVASNGGQSCTGDRVQTLIQTCVFSPCPVNGGLTQWTLWTEPPCGINCGTRTDVLRTRSRSCSNPAPSNGGLACNGPFVETAQKSCAFSPCVVNGGLTQWTQWTNPACGITCGSTNSLVRSRTRSCTNPAPSNGGQQCFGNTVETILKSCVLSACPVNGGYTLWTQWTNPPCGITCGSRTDVTRTRTRSCTNPAPSNGGQPCTGPILDSQTTQCSFSPCPVNGGLTLWTQWTDASCGITCGTRTDVVRSRTRSCTNPPPSNGGQVCTGTLIENVPISCVFPACDIAVNGGFTQWTQWTTLSCGISCGSTNSLVRSRSRSCTNPVPRFGGQQCFGDRLQTNLQPCVFNPCPVNGGLTQWTQWTNPPCVITCGIRTDISRTRTRSCSNPAPSNGGLPCSGPLVDVLPQTCSFTPCPVNGGLTLWTQWTDASCGITCGTRTDVVRTRTRSCTNPPPSNGGQVCTGTLIENVPISCVFPACDTPINGGFTQWTQWTTPSCGITCGSTNSIVRSRTRSCTNPLPRFGGQQCIGETLETTTQLCVFNPCPVNGGLTLWSQWTNPECGITCGTRSNVVRTRTRSCTNPAPSNGGVACTGLMVESLQKSCAFAPCPVNGGLTGWSLWTDASCGITCGTRTDVVRSRTRSCTNPAPSNGGQVCTGTLVETVPISCVFPACDTPINGGLTQWTQWTNPSCGITCGSTFSVFRARTRSCTNPTPRFGGQQCFGDTVQTVPKQCVFNACTVNGGLTAWTQWTEPICGITCGTRNDVIRTRTRSCTNPPASNGGQTCTGPFVEFSQRNCVFAPCLVVVNGGFTQWTQWTNPSCGITCGTGSSVVKMRTRACSNPPPSNGGTSCVGDRIQTLAQPCFFSPCLVNGGFTLWTEWTNPPCGINCGTASSVIRTRTRTCTNPAPSNGGQNCFGLTVEVLPKTCVFEPCGVNGDFTQWTQWTSPSCGITCGSTNNLVRQRTRSCRNPVASNGGQQCFGNTIETLSQSCVFAPCQVVRNGGLTLWSQWTDPPCGITCGTGDVSRSRFRSCTSPVPSGGGQDCSGTLVEVIAKNCVLSPCVVPVNGGLTQWTQWTNPTCTITCGSANSLVRSRSRSCTNPVPSNGGQSCSGDRVQTSARPCIFNSCPVDGGLTFWTQWTNPPCGISCGTRTDLTRTRTRSCTNPPPSNGGQGCTGPFLDVTQQICSFSACVVNGAYTEWTQWTAPSCGITCGSTNSRVRSRTRSCTNPAPSNGGQQCFGNTLETSSTQCVFSACPVDGGLTLWTEWTNPPCSSACVIRTRTRSCTNPPPSNGGLNCTGALLGVVKKTCDNVPCLVPVNGSFTQWTEWTGPPCSVTCGAGPSVVRRRSRSCTNPPPSNGGNGCFGDVLQTISTPCSFPECGGLCTSVTYRDGIGYRYHPTDCDKYIQCYNNPNGNVVAMYRRCPFGKFWNQVTFQCDDSWRVVCPHDKCKDNSTATFNLLGSCRAYWECDTNFVAVPKCCGVGYSYVHREGCKPNLFCRDLCPTACEDRDLCDKRPDWNANPATYNMSVGILGWVPTSCAAGTQFDITNCGCSALNQFCSASNAVTFTAGSSLTSALASWLELSNVEVSNGIANFNGSSRLVATVTMPTASTANPLIIRFRYRESGAVFGRRVLVSTSDCKNGSSLVIAVDSYTMTFELTSWYNWAVTLPVSMAGFSRDDWKTVTFSYAGYDMLAVVESATLKYAAKVHAPQSTIMQCGLTFGTDSKNDATNNFIGQLDQLSLYQCDPGNLY